MLPRRLLLLATALSIFLSHRNLASAYQILGGLERESPEKKKESPTHQEYLRHLDLTLDLEQRLYEQDGSVSQAGTAWEGSRLLADYITNPATSRMWKDKNVLELGSGLGICAIAAALCGAQVIATDASTTSLELLRVNSQRYAHLCPTPVAVQPFLWGDAETLNLLRHKFPVYPDVIMASDVVFFRSNREGLRTTIEALCGPNTQVFLAHMWRSDPEQDQKFFQESFSIPYNGEVEAHLFPLEYQRRGSDGRFPISIFCLGCNGTSPRPG